MTLFAQGPLLKMSTALADPTGGEVQYTAILGANTVPFNPHLGKKIRLTWAAEIRCVACGALTRKSFNQGHCWSCFSTLASCDTCIMKPETCHHHHGTCREPVWGTAHCFVPHTVYLANSSGLKVGITRAHQRWTRWMDQGASAAIPLVSVATRRDSGLVEDHCRSVLGIADRTSWQKLLKGSPETVDLEELRNKVLTELPSDLQWEASTDAPTIISYPVLEYPTKVTSLDLEKKPVVEGILRGIKGQYLLLDSGVINLRKFSGYVVGLEIEE
jgi:hypothetical protein